LVTIVTNILTEGLLAFYQRALVFALLLDYARDHYLFFTLQVEISELVDSIDKWRIAQLSTSNEQIHTSRLIWEQQI